jgi:hypothetical protein
VLLLLHRFYIQQKAFDHAAGNPLKEDIKRKQREAKERTQEADMLESLYQVGDHPSLQGAHVHVTFSESAMGRGPCVLGERGLTTLSYTCVLMGAITC